MLITLEGRTPDVADDVFVADGARLIGNLTIRSGASVWFNAVIRADADRIMVGEFSNIQDNSTIHADPGYPCLIGRYVTVGHNAVVHGCVVEDNVLVGMHATVLTGAVIGRDSIVGANALVTEGAVIPAGSLVVGIPARVLRALRPDEIERVRESAVGYNTRAHLYLKSGRLAITERAMHD